MLFAFHFIIACHAMFFESLLIYYLFHFFHFPFFCMLFLLFLPFLQSSVPVCRHNGDDRTSSSRLVSHSCLSYFSALLSGKTSLGRGRKKKKKKENAVFKGKPHFKWTDLINISSFLRLESLSSLVISVVSFITSCPGSRPALIPKRSRNDRSTEGASDLFQYSWLLRSLFWTLKWNLAWENRNWNYFFKPCVKFSAFFFYFKSIRNGLQELHPSWAPCLKFCGCSAAEPLTSEIRREVFVITLQKEILQTNSNTFLSA